jgi:hypothetical protein
MRHISIALGLIVVLVLVNEFLQNIARARGEVIISLIAQQCRDNHTEWTECNWQEKELTRINRKMSWLR